MSFAIKLYLKNGTALTNTFFITIFKDIYYNISPVWDTCIIIESWLHGMLNIWDCMGWERPTIEFETYTNLQYGWNGFLLGI